MRISRKVVVGVTGAISALALTAGTLTPAQAAPNSDAKAATDWLASKVSGGVLNAGGYNQYGPTLDAFFAFKQLGVRKAKRKAPVYLDVMRNAAGQTLVPPFSVRWRPRAPVSMPLDWDEVSPRLDPVVFNLRTAERRMAAKAPWSSFFGHRQTLPRD